MIATWGRGFSPTRMLYSSVIARPRPSFGGGLDDRRRRARPRDESDGQLIERIHDKRHDRRTEGVSAGRDDHGEYDDSNEDVAPVSPELLDRDDADLRQQDDHDRELHH